MVFGICAEINQSTNRTNIRQDSEETEKPNHIRIMHELREESGEVKKPKENEIEAEGFH
jgi:hypothetical protein